MNFMMLPPCHSYFLCAAIKNSLFPSGPSTGLSTIPSTDQAGWRANQALMRSHTS